MQGRVRLLSLRRFNFAVDMEIHPVSFFIQFCQALLQHLNIPRRTHLGEHLQRLLVSLAGTLPVAWFITSYESIAQIN